MNFLDHIEINPAIRMTKGEEYPFVDMASVSTKNRIPDRIERKVFSSGVTTMLFLCFPTAWRLR